MIDFVLRRKLLVVLAWIVLAASGFIASSHLGSRLDYTYTTPGQPGYEANLHIADRFVLDAAFEPTIAMLQLPAGESMATAAGQADAARTFDAAHKAGIDAVADYADTGDSHFVLDGGRTTWALISLPNPDKGPGKGMARRLAGSLQAAVPQGATLTLTGFEQLLEAGNGEDPNILLELALGALGALLLLLFVYGSAIAVVPVFMAVPTMLVTYLCVYTMTYVAQVSYFVPVLILLLGLGITIDYSLIIVVRWREERERLNAGRNRMLNDAAIRAAMRSSGRAVVLSGITVSVGLLSLVTLPVPYLRSVGYGGMLIPFVATLATLTLLPITLATVGPFLDRLRLFHGSTTYSGIWERWGRFILRHRVVTLAAGLLIVLSLALPGLQINTAEPNIASLAGQGLVRRQFEHLVASGVPAAIDFPIQILTHDGEAGVQKTKSLALATPGIYDVFAPDTPDFRHGNDALLIAVPMAEGSSAEGKQIVTRLREHLASVPGRAKVGGAEVGGAEVGGSTAADMSFTAAVYGNFPLLLALVSVVTLLILTWALRSVVLAVKAVALNLISLGSVFGFMVLFWQKGFGATPIYGYPPTGAIRDWIPSVIFACLFGLSMDYEVFVLVRMREEYDRLGSTDEAIVQGLARTGRVVTSAAIILMLSFLSLSSGPNQINKIISTTLAFGVLIDAVIVRTMLVPPLVSLLGQANWWMPAPLAALFEVPSGNGR